MTAVPRASGVGSLPGGAVLGSESDNARAYAEAVRMVLADLPDLPHLPELPGRGAAASLTGRGLAVMAHLAADLQPHAWRLTDHPGVDHRRARSLLAQDLDQVEEQSQGFAGSFKTQVIGPWTLAATVEMPRGELVLADHGARRDLAQALAEGVREHVADLRRRLPDVTELIVQFDEPALTGVLAGQVPTISGFGRHRVIDPPEVSEALSEVAEAVTSAVPEEWAVPIVHSCAPEVPIDLILGAGLRGVSVDVGLLSASRMEQLAAAAEAGDRVLLGLVPSTSSSVSASALIERGLRILDMLGADPGDLGDRLVVTPTCGLAGADASWPRRAMQLSREVARGVSGAE